MDREREHKKMLVTYRLEIKRMKLIYNDVVVKGEAGFVTDTMYV